MIYLRLLLASFLWGSNVVLMKSFLNDIPFILLCFLRVLLSCFSIYLFMIFSRYKKIKHNHFILLICGFLGIYMNFIFTMQGMKHSFGNQSALVNALIPVFTLLSSYLFLHQSLNKIELLSIVLCLIGFIVSVQSFHIGIIYMILGSLFYISSFIIMKKYKIKQDLSFIFYQLLYGLFFLFVHCMISNHLDISVLYHISFIKTLLFIIISGVGFAYIQYTYIYSIEKIGLNKTSFYLSLNPLITYIESILLFHEKIDLRSIIGFALIIVSLLTINFMHSKIIKLHGGLTKYDCDEK